MCKRYVRDFCVYMGVFEDGSANAANRILPRLTLVAIETKRDKRDLDICTRYLRDSCI